MEAMHKFYDDPDTKPPLDPSLYSLQPDELQFFQRLTGIQDEEALKDHIIVVQRKAYKLYGYPCIRHFNFLRLKITRLPAYHKALRLLEWHRDPIFLDMGCCFGNDTRKIVMDGWPAENVLASDLRQGFWDCGHELFNSTPTTFPVKFVQGDIFDPSFLSTSTKPEFEVSEQRFLPTLMSLTPFRQHISAIHASAFFHLFAEDQQLELARRLAVLLVRKRGSIIFGAHVGRPVKGFREEVSGDNKERILMFCHSPESWCTMWKGEVFAGLGWNMQVNVGAKLVYYLGVDLERDDTVATEDGKFYEMQWSVEIL
ncbi:hypothetical protein CPB84DRAFT_1797249 [Gymnopilus junonius]|uniref:Methyltransferase domain-containing protein n=1 Tax=Gymnopilus junonius TaxID=109634 RepID=A0A9P5NAX3_GYMJU|nr:hypothetical protein CPB84DRAFT_1797249 [Gymnopilus junonius]